MSIVVDSSFTDSTTATQGFLTGLQKGTVYKSSSPSSKATATPVSFYFDYSSDDSANQQQYGASVTTDSAMPGASSSASNTNHLSSLSQLILSGDSSSSSVSSSGKKSASSATSSSSGHSISSPRQTNKKLSLLVGTMVGLSVLLTTL